MVRSVERRNVESGQERSVMEGSGQVRQGKAGVLGRPEDRNG